MKKYNFILLILSIAISSCVGWNLDDLPAYDEANITDFDLEHRYILKNNNGHEYMASKTLNAEVDINNETKVITVQPSVPDASNNFTEEERKNVNLSSITAYVKISPAAKIKPQEGAPILGKPGSWTEQHKYIVTAADNKTSNEWTIIVKPLPVIN